MLKRTDSHVLSLDTEFSDIAISLNDYEVDVKNALQALDNALSKGSITEDQKTRYQSTFMLMKQAYDASKNRTREYLQEAEHAQQTLREHKLLDETFDSLGLTKEHEVLLLEEGAEIKPKGKNLTGERRKLLRYRNEVDCFELKYGKLSTIMSSLVDEKDRLTSELKRIADFENIKSKKIQEAQEISQLQHQVDAFQKTVTSLATNIEEREKEYKTQEVQIKEKEKTADDLKIKLFTVETDVAQVVRNVMTLQNDIDTIKNKYVQEERNTINLEHERLACELQIERLQEAEVSGRNEIALEENKVIGKKLEIQTAERTCSEQEDKITSIMSSISELVGKVEETDAGKSKAQVMASALSKDREKCLKVLQKLEEEKNSLLEKKKLMGYQYQKLLVIHQEFPRNEMMTAKRQAEIGEKIASFQKKLLRERALTAINRNLVDKLATDYNAMCNTQKEAKVSLDDLLALATTRMKEKQKLKDELLRLSKRYSQMEIETRVINGRLDSVTQQEIIAQRVLLHSEKEYELMREDKTRVFRQVLLTKQKALEWQEKALVVGNEQKNLQGMKEEKVRQLERLRGKSTSEKLTRDALKCERDRKSQVVRNTKKELEKAISNVEKVHTAINRCRQRGENIHKHFEAVVVACNERGLEVRDRIEETCIFTEKLKELTEMLKVAESDMIDRIKDIHKLMTIRDIEKSEVKILNTFQSQKPQLQSSVTELAIELRKTLTYEEKLECRFDHPMDRQKEVGIPAQDENKEALQKRLFELEKRLYLKELELLEKKLVYEHVQRITKTINEKAEEVKVMIRRDSLESIIQNAKLNGTTNKVKSLISEVTLMKATATKLEKEVEEKRNLLMRAKERVTRGEPPTEEAFKEWVTKVKTDKWRQGNFSKEEPQEIPTPRPHFYIPNIQGRKVLPLPVAYGKHAPFKPFLPPPVLRLFKKPKPPKIIIS